MPSPSILAVGLIAGAAIAPAYAVITTEPPQYDPISGIAQSSSLQIYAVSEYNTAEIRIKDQQGDFYRSNYVERDTTEAYSEARAVLSWYLQENSANAWGFHVATDLYTYAEHTHLHGIQNGTMGTVHMAHTTEFTLDRPTEYILNGYASSVTLSEMVYNEEFGAHYQRLDALISPREPTEITGVLEAGRYQMTYRSSTSTSRSYFPRIFSNEGQKYSATNEVKHFASLRLTGADSLEGGAKAVPEIDAKNGAISLGLLAAIWALFRERRRGKRSAERQPTVTAMALAQLPTSSFT